MNILTTTKKKEKEIEFRDEIIYKEVITQFKDFSVKKDPNSDISEYWYWPAVMKKPPCPTV